MGRAPLHHPSQPHGSPRIRTLGATDFAAARSRPMSARQARLPPHSLSFCDPAGLSMNRALRDSLAAARLTGDGALPDWSRIILLQNLAGVPTTRQLTDTYIGSLGFN